MLFTIFGKNRPARPTPTPASITDLAIAASDSSHNRKCREALYLGALLSHSCGMIPLCQHKMDAGRDIEVFNQQPHEPRLLNARDRVILLEITVTGLFIAALLDKRPQCTLPHCSS
jgi:hypothetical protein